MILLSLIKFFRREVSLKNKQFISIYRLSLRLRLMTLIFFRFLSAMIYLILLLTFRALSLSLLVSLLDFIIITPLSFLLLKPFFLFFPSFLLFFPSFLSIPSPFLPLSSSAALSKQAFSSFLFIFFNFLTSLVFFSIYQRSFILSFASRLYMIFKSFLIPALRLAFRPILRALLTIVNSVSGIRGQIRGRLASVLTRVFKRASGAEDKGLTDQS